MSEMVTITYTYERLEIGGIVYEVKPYTCPRCDGDGIEPDPKSNHPRPRPGGGFDCYECGGEGKVFELEVEK